MVVVVTRCGMMSGFVVVVVAPVDGVRGAFAVGGGKGPTGAAVVVTVVVDVWLEVDVAALACFAL